jgi:hypothetical protein
MTWAGGMRQNNNGASGGAGLEWFDGSPVDKHIVRQMECERVEIARLRPVVYNGVLEASEHGALVDTLDDARFRGEFLGTVLHDRPQELLVLVVHRVGKSHGVVSPRGKHPCNVITTALCHQVRSE